MASLIQKAASGNPAALQALYNANKQSVFCMTNALIRNESAAASITYKALKAATQELMNGSISTEEDFTAYAVKQAVSNSTQEVLRKDGKAFRVPAKKDFRLLHIQESAIDPNASALENYLNCLPHLHRFIFVLRYTTKFPAGKIGVCIGMEPRIIERAFEAEADNLSKIYRAVKAAGAGSFAPTSEMLKSAFSDAIDKTVLPEETENLMAEYLLTITEPARKQARKQKMYGLIIGGITVILAIVLAVMLSSGSTESETMFTSTEETETVEATEAAETTAATKETEMTEPFNITEPVEETIEATDAIIADPADYTALIEIEDYGTITVALDSESAPITVANFVELAESGFYDGLTFHRIMEDFMMQGGDPNGDGTGGSEETIVGEFTDNGYANTLSHTRGAISMARSNDYNSASSQFFIVHEDSTFLDGQYAVFGYVTDGMDIVDAICESAEPTDDNGSIDPDAQPVIKSISIQEQE